MVDFPEPDSLLHDPPAGHHDDPVRPVRGHPDVVRDQQRRRAGLGPQRVEVVEDPALHRGVEGAGRLVGE
ncbi:hypothetical protein ACQP04_21305 [Pseudonocardia halophobica]|uniref:hypothetical protein n=1 Tax=Pseudonocardia halophobica TaxID=29401 RepID=UPI003D8C5B6B